jgi:hypothetical protein
MLFILKELVVNVFSWMKKRNSFINNTIDISTSFCKEKIIMKFAVD